MRNMRAETRMNACQHLRDAFMLVRALRPCVMGRGLEWNGDSIEMSAVASTSI